MPHRNKHRPCQGLESLEGRLAPSGGLVKHPAGHHAAEVQHRHPTVAKAQHHAAEDNHAAGNDQAASGHQAAEDHATTGRKGGHDDAPTHH